MTSEIEIAEERQDRIDNLIWRYVGVKPVGEIARMAGVGPDEIMRRKSDLLNSVDVLTIQEKRQKIVVELDLMARDARDRAKDASDEFYAGTINAATGALKTVLQELARMDKQDTEKVNALNAMRVQELLRLVDETVARSITEIAATHKLDEGDLMEVFQGHLMSAARDMEGMN